MGVSPEPFWEKTYKDKTAQTFGKPSSKFVMISEKLPKEAMVLDLGCGEGRNALFLGEHGFKVTAIDISQNGVKKLQAEAQKITYQLRHR